MHWFVSIRATLAIYQEVAYNFYIPLCKILPRFVFYVGSSVIAYNHIQHMVESKFQWFLREKYL